MLIAICGLPGSGKTYFSKALAKQLDIPRLSTDELREKMQKLGHYDEGSRLSVYQEIAKKANLLLDSGKSIIIDGSFNNHLQRQVIAYLAQNQKLALAFIHCYANDEISLARVTQRRDHTEADSRVYFLLKDLWEPLTVPHLKLDTGLESLEKRLEKAKAYLATF